MAREASAASASAIFSWGAPRRRGLWRLWPGEEKHLQLAQLHQDEGHPAGKVLLPIHQPPAAGEAWHLSLYLFKDTNLLSVVWFGWQQPQQPQLLRNFMISRFNRSLWFPLPNAISVLISSSLNWFPTLNNPLKWISVHCSAAQYTAVQNSTLQCSVVHCSSAQYTAVQLSTLQCSTVHCSPAQYTTVQHSTLQCSTVHCSAA